jgi:hypothetical protein
LQAEAAERGHDADTLVRTVAGRTANRVQQRTVSAVDRLFDRLAGPDGLTASASTFTRRDVLVALGAGLAGAGRTELEELADRFLVERAVSVVADWAVEERRWSTPDLLAVEQQLVTSATGRIGEHTAVVSHEAVGEALATHTTAGVDQQAMVSDLSQGGQGIALVVGRAGTVGLGWRLWFRPSTDTLAWRCGAAGERRTARLLAPLERRGWAVLHDLAVPGTQANLDHLVIGPGGVLVIDSKHYRGRLWLDHDGIGLAWPPPAGLGPAQGGVAGRPG